MKIIGEKPSKTLQVNVGNGHATYALFNGVWYSVNFDGSKITDVRWQASIKERDQIISILVNRNR